MTSIERARRFIQSKGRTIALTLVPLASLAAITAPAKASSVSFTPANCNATAVGSGSASCVVNQLPAANGITGLTMSGMGTVSNLSGTTAELGVQFDTSGSASGSFGPGTLPYRYDFIIGNSNGDTLEYILNTDIYTTGKTLDFQVVQTTSGSGTVSANTGLVIPSNVTITGYYFDIDLSDMNSSPNQTLSLNVPAGQSVDLGGASTTSTTPEPATISLVGSAIAGLMFWRKRKKAEPSSAR